MIKKFKIVAESTIMDIEMNTIQLDQAIRMYDRIKNSTEYSKGCIIDSATGEIDRHFERKIEDGGLKFSEWIAIS